MAAKQSMIQGTASNSGRSLLTAALCRIFKQDGYRVAPFKSQNMALNCLYYGRWSGNGTRTSDAGGSRRNCSGCSNESDSVKAYHGDVGSQVILCGKAIGNRTAKEYWSDKSTRPFTRQLDSLANDYDIIVIEGAGSPAEINLKQDDIGQYGNGRIATCSCLLVGDIDRGGVFASLYGTVKLLEPDERSS